ncbi:TetR family transcriptional regulator C-terminal domain-containing protein [Nonomuraea basaltis]|uniref:TetR family transcriptional regulator C-terminal domain-containing protein n=1 Tax=Nonomuraea basaltis TaxID=2495887 RepID=UPI00110C5780|nr:hypothetical protein [Nonomuraea basaltis]TMR94009.1 hypothetical protein EJK15_36115 [Nonomuraea basaltis]
MTTAPPLRPAAGANPLPSLADIAEVVQAAALRRYLERQSRPVFDALAADRRGLPAIAGFFERLVAARCTGEHARWGCLVTNTHASASRGLPEVEQTLQAHHDALRAAMRAGLEPARERGHLRPGLDVEAAADTLALPAYRSFERLRERLSGVAPWTRQR